MTDKERETIADNMLNPNLKKGDIVGYINGEPVYYEGQWGDYIVLEDKKDTNNGTTSKKTQS